MSSAKLIQTNWTAGEISPAMLGRVDTAKYANGAEQLSNFLVRQQGGLWYRQGSRFVNAAKFANKKSIVREFEFSDLQSYEIEFGEGYCRIYFDGGFVETAPGSGVPLEVVLPYQEADLASLKFTQSADILYICSPKYPPRLLRRLGANAWDSILYVNLDGPYAATTPDATLVISTVYSTAQAVAKFPLFNVPTVNKNITGIANSGGVIRLTVVAHGMATNDIVTIINIQLNNGVALRQSTYPHGNGPYKIVVINANTIDLFNSVYQATISDTYDITTAQVQASVVIGQYVEYREDNLWKLMKLQYVTNSTHATVVIVQGVKQDVNHAVKLTYDGSGHIISDHTGVFTADDTGKYVRLFDGSWAQLGTYNSDTSMNRQSVPSLQTYTYPTNTVTIPTGTPQTTATVTSDVALFAATDIGRHIRFNFYGKQPWGKINSYLSPTSVVIALFADIPLDPTDVGSFSNNGATQIFKLGAWSDTTGWPRAASFHEQRLWFGGTNAEPQALWGSKPGDYVNHAPTEYDSLVLDSSAISYTIVSNKANPIIWLESSAVLLIGTLGGEWMAKAASAVVAPITPTNIIITPQTNNGSLQNCREHKSGTASLYVQLAGQKLIEMTYEFQMDSYVGRNLTVISEHILRQGGGALDIVYQREPNCMIWARLADGTLAALTYERDQQVAAWHRHSLGGNAFVESISCARSATGKQDLLYMVVRRVVNGATVRYIEYMTADFYPVNPQDRSNAFFLDCGLTYSGVPITHVTGLTHLTGEQVSVVSDGIYRGEFNEAAGTLDNPIAASVINVGYKYRGLAKMLPLEGGAPGGGPTTGKTKRVGKTCIKMLNSLNFRYGIHLNKLDEYRPVMDDGVTLSTDLFTGDRIVDMPMGYKLSASYYIVQDSPYPLILLSVAPDVEVTT